MRSLEDAAQSAAPGRRHGGAASMERRLTLVLT